MTRTEDPTRRAPGGRPLNLEELEYLIEDWRETPGPFAFDEVADLLHGTIHRLLMNAIGDEIVTLDHLVELFAPTLDLRPRDTDDVLYQYLRWHVPGVAVSPSGRVARLSTILGDLRFRHVLTEAEARTERLEAGLDVSVLLDGVDSGSVSSGPLARSLRTAVDGEESSGPGVVAVVEGPTGWLGGAAAGATVALRRTGELVVVETVADGDRTMAVDAFRAALDLLDPPGPIDVYRLFHVAALEAGGLGEDLGAPLSDILVEAGWEARGEELAPAGFDWEAHAAESRRRGREVTMARAGVAGAHMIEPIESLVVELFGERSVDDEFGVREVADRDVGRVAGLLSEPGVAAAVFALGLPVFPESAVDVYESVLALAESLLDRADPARRSGPARLGLLAAERAARTDALVRLAEQASLQAVDDEDLCGIAGDLALDQGRLDDAKRHYFRGDVVLSNDVEQVLRGVEMRPMEAGRNEPCPCGSGQKFKRCHGSPTGPPLSDVERAQLLIARLDRHELRRRRYLRHRWTSAAGLEADEEWLTDDASTYLPFLETLTWFEAGGLADFLDQRGSLLPDADRRLAESWLGAPIVVARGEGDEVPLPDGRVAEREFSLWVMPSMGSRSVDIGRVVPLSDRLVFLRAFWVRPRQAEGAEQLLTEAGDDPEAIARVVGELRQRPTG